MKEEVKIKPVCGGEHNRGELKITERERVGKEQESDR